MKTHRTLIAAILAILVGTSIPARAQTRLTMPVDVDALRGPELIGFVDAVLSGLPDDEEGSAFDLATLARLHGHFLSNVYTRDRVDELRKQDTQERLEVVLRRALGQVNTPELRRLALGEDENSNGIAELFPALCQRWIEAEVTEILSEQKPELNFPADPPPMPEHLQLTQRSGPGVAEFKRALGPFAALLAELNKRPPLGQSAEGDRYGELTQAFLMDRDKKIATELLRFRGASFCGNGMVEFLGTRMTFVFMGLLRERRLEEALGVSFQVPHAPEWLREPGRPFETWRGDLLKWCGFDPEVVMLGAQRLEYLAAAGSERAANEGIAVIESNREEYKKWPWSLQSLAAFLIPGQAEYWEDTDPRKAIAAKTQTRILGLLDRAVRDDLPFNELDRMLKIFEHLNRPETKLVLHRILANPSTTYADRAAWVLRRMGEEIAPIEPAPPVRFRLYLNDQPWRSAEINYKILDSKIPHMGGDSVKTDAEGFTTIPRDVFLDPAVGGTVMRFSKKPSGLAVKDKKRFDEPWVQGETGVPRAFDELTSVRLTMCPLPIEIEYTTPPPPARKVPAQFRLTKADDTDPNAPGFDLHFNERFEANQRCEVPDHFLLSAITPGLYRLFAVVAGSARYSSEPIAVKPDMASVRVQLEKGAHVYASIRFPQNARWLQVVHAPKRTPQWVSGIQLYKDGEEVTDQYVNYSSFNEVRPVFTGVPKGNYQLRILSTAELEAMSKTPSSLDTLKGVDCEGVTVDFTIDDSTPALLYLGDLECKPTPAMRDQAGPMQISMETGPPP